MTLTHKPRLIFLSSSGKDKNIPTPSSCPQVQGGGPGTVKLLSPAPAAPCSDHPEMLEEHWDAQKMPLNKTCKMLHSVREAGMSKANKD